MRYRWYPLEWYEAERGGILSTATDSILWSAMSGIFWVIQLVSFGALQVVSFDRYYQLHAFSKGELTEYEFVNACFSAAEQVNEIQDNLLSAAIELATGGSAQLHIGTGGGGSTSELPWRDKDKSKYTSGQRKRWIWVTCVLSCLYTRGRTKKLIFDAPSLPSHSNVIRYTLHIRNLL